MMRSYAHRTKAVLSKYLAAGVCEAHFCSQDKLKGKAMDN